MQQQASAARTHDRRQPLPAIGARSSTQPSGRPEDRQVAARFATTATSEAQQLIGQLQEELGQAEAGKARRDEVARLHGEVERLHGILKHKDEQLAKKDETYREDMTKLRLEKDEQLANLRQEYREDMTKKDDTHREDLNRLMQQLSGIGMPPIQTTIPVQQRASFSPVPPTQPLSAPVPPAHRRVQRAQVDAVAPQEQPTQPIYDASPSTDSAVLVAQLQGGGDEAEEVLTTILESVLQVLEILAAGTPRKQRRAVKVACAQVESVLEGIDSDFVERLATSQPAELMQLGGKLGSLQLLRTGEVSVECLSAVKDALHTVP